MNLLVIADTDTVEDQIGHDPAELLVACGDLDDAFIDRIARKSGVSRVLAVKGNHDTAGPFPSPTIDLHLTTFTYGDISFGGFGGSWRYKPRGHHLYEQDEVARLLADFPPVDVFVAHNSPRGIHDRNDEVHFGFDAFNDYIERAKPRLFLHGHQHVNCQTQVGQTQVIGVYGFRYLEIPE
jgi:Icc-related predicted phosphoesterase